MLPGPERLRSNNQFQQVYRDGQSFSDDMVVLYLLRLPDSDVRQAGFSVSKKVGVAVVRNRTKRQLREIYRLRLPMLPTGYQAVFVARRRAAAASYAQLERAMTAVLTRAGLLSRPDVV